MPPLSSNSLSESATFATVALIAVAIFAIIACVGFPSLVILPSVSVGVYGLTLLFLPKYRPLLRMPLCPINFAHFIIAIKFVIMPLNIVVAGLKIGDLPGEPSITSMLKALMLSCLLLVSFAIGFSLSRNVQATGAYNLPLAHEGERMREGNLAFGVCCLLIGLIGMYLAFPDPNALLAYYLNPPKLPGLATSGFSAMPQQVVSSLFRPFLPFGLIICWSAYLGRPRVEQSVLLRASVTVVTAVLMALVFLSYSFNRGSFVFPLVALVASYSRHVAYISAKRLLVFALLTWLPLAFVGTYRSSPYSLTQLLEEDTLRSELSGNTNSSLILQEYAAGPQFQAYFFDSFDWNPPLTYGRTSLSSLLYPVPVLGKPFRQYSGVIAYNQVLRGHYILDSVVPFETELFCDFHIVGVLCGGLLFGAVIKRFQNAFEESRGKIDTYISQYMSMWVIFLFVGGVSVVSQIFIVFMWPIYAWKMMCIWKTASEASLMPAFPRRREQVLRTGRWRRRIVERTAPR